MQNPPKQSAHHSGMVLLNDIKPQVCSESAPPRRQSAFPVSLCDEKSAARQGDNAVVGDPASISTNSDGKKQLFVQMAGGTQGTIMTSGGLI